MAQAHYLVNVGFLLFSHRSIWFHSQRVAEHERQGFWSKKDLSLVGLSASHFLTTFKQVTKMPPFSSPSGVTGEEAPSTEDTTKAETLGLLFILLPKLENCRGSGSFLLPHISERTSLAQFG